MSARLAAYLSWAVERGGGEEEGDRVKIIGAEPRCLAGLSRSHVSRWLTLNFCGNRTRENCTVCSETDAERFPPLARV